MTVQMVPASGVPLANPYVKTAVSTKQFLLTGSNGSTWTDLGPSAGRRSTSPRPTMGWSS